MTVRKVSYTNQLVHQFFKNNIPKMCLLLHGSYKGYVVKPNTQSGWNHVDPHIGSCTKENNEMCGLVVLEDTGITETDDPEIYDEATTVETTEDPDYFGFNARSGRRRGGGRHGVLKDYFLRKADKSIQNDEVVSNSSEPDPPTEPTEETKETKRTEPTTNPVISSSEEPSTTEPTPPPSPGICRCGYLNEVEDKKILLLAPDDKGICRGLPGYPCKSYFLGKNKEGREGFDESCISRKCDKELDMCVQSRNKGNSTDLGVRVRRTAESSLIGGGFVLIFMGYIIM